MVSLRVVDCVKLAERTYEISTRLAVELGVFANDHDARIATEDRLLEKMSCHSIVDGHDLGSREMNLFVVTDDPNAFFAQVKEILRAQVYGHVCSARYRKADGSRYTILWPKHLTQFDVA
jgi:hypothetical protein